MKASQSVRVVLRCSRLPGRAWENRTAVVVGIQRKADVLDDVPGDAREAVFAATVEVRTGDDGAPDFGGPYVFGKKGERFLYLCWGERAGGAWQGFRRAKIQLGHAPAEIWQAAVSGGRDVEARLELTDAKGGPKCASLKPHEVEWVLET